MRSKKKVAKKYRMFCPHCGAEFGYSVPSDVDEKSINCYVCDTVFTWKREERVCWYLGPFGKCSLRCDAWKIKYCTARMYDGSKPPEMQQVSEEDGKAALATVLNFGRYKDQTIKQVIESGNEGKKWLIWAAMNVEQPTEKRVLRDAINYLILVEQKERAASWEEF